MSFKPIIYQVLPRIFGNKTSDLVPGSSFKTNGCGKLDDFTLETLDTIKDLGCTHIWFTGILRHATKTAFPECGLPANHPSIVKGEAGSPYSITDYYDVAPSIATNPANRMNEFVQLIARCKSLSIGVIIDFVPNHLSREYKSVKRPGDREEFGAHDKIDYSFHPSNNFYYILGSSFKSPAQSTDIKPYIEIPAKVTGNDCINPEPSDADWYETVKLNYGYDIFSGSRQSFFNPIPDTWNKMYDILDYWLCKGVSGFRCDMAEMVPLDFWEWVIQKTKENHKDVIFIAETYNPHSYSLFLKQSGFDYLYDKVGLYDTLKAITRGEKECSEISKCWHSLGLHENNMLNFTENHDEVRLASKYFATDPYKGLPALVVSLLLNKSPYMLYFGQELGEKGEYAEGFSKEDGKTSIFDYWSLESIRNWRRGEFDQKLRNIYKALLNLANTEKAFTEGEKYDLHYANSKNPQYEGKENFSFSRKHGSSFFIIHVSFNNPDKEVKFNLPNDMFQFFKLPKVNLCEMRDMLNGDIWKGQLESDKTIHFGKCSNGIKIIKLSL